MNKYSKLIKNTGLFAISSFGSKILTFLILPLYSYVLTTSEFGIVDIYLTSLNLLLPVISLSIFDAVFRFVIDAETSEKKLQFFETGVTFSTICMIASAFVALPASFLMKTQVVNIWMFWLLIIFQMFISCIQQFLRAINKIAAYSISSVIYTFSYLICNVVFLAFLKYGVAGYLLSYVVAGVITCVYLIIILHPQIKALGRFRFSLLHLRSMLQYCIPLIPNAVLLWIMNAINRWFILYYCGTDSNGLYAFACKIPTILSMFTNVFFQAWQLSAIDEKESKDTSFSESIYSTITIICYVFTTIILTCARPMVKIFTETSYWTAAEYIPYLLLGIVFQTFASFYGTIYIAYKKTRAVLITSAIGAGITIIGNAIFVPLYGVQAACVITMVSYFFVWFIRMIDTKKLYSIKVNKPFLIISIVLMLLQAIVFFISDLFVVNIVFIAAMIMTIVIVERSTISIIYRKMIKKG